MCKRSKWIKDLHVRAKILRRKHSRNRHDLGLENGFFTMTPKAKATTKIDELDIKMKNLSVSKDAKEKVERQHEALEQMFASHISDEGLVFRMHKSNHNFKKKQRQFYNGQRKPHVGVYSSFLHKCQNLETATMSFNR